MTPPLVPKITPPPERMENGVSGAVGSRSANWIPSSRIMEASSLVVRTASMSGFPFRMNSSRSASIFFAVHGMMATLKVSRPHSSSEGL
ncbi:unknown [Clostridium sp. CAG:58]|nr:unknown [Clostridium sp. CAG:58]